MNLNITLLGEMITFALFVLFTMKFVWPPIMQALDKRQKEISDGLEAAQLGKQELEIAKHKAKEIIVEAKSQATVIVERANHAAHSITEDAKIEARNAASRIKSKAKAETKDNIALARQELQGELADLVVSALGKVLSNNVDKNNNLDVVKNLLGQMELNEKV
ncbi:MAG: F0F1 ATP synthase subunit B [Thiotrichales bacterium]|nr:MAG: F0F1 ATP synthase subunit B [Thiotrichales bacterium]